MIALDAEKPDNQSILFGYYLARLTGSGLTGIFLEDLPAEDTQNEKIFYNSVFSGDGNPGSAPEIAFKEKISLENIRVFKTACEQRGIAWLVHRDQGAPLKELITESSYADLIITGAGLFASSPLETPAGLVEDLLVKSECPVIITAHRAEPVAKIVFACDGSVSSLFAIKQFTYLFPELNVAELIVLQANKDAVFSETQKERLYEYLKEHYKRINFKDLRGKPEDELFDYALRENNACIVMGAYGRNWLSRLFKPSAAEMPIKINNLPVFISHR